MTPSPTPVATGVDLVQRRSGDDPRRARCPELTDKVSRRASDAARRARRRLPGNRRRSRPPWARSPCSSSSPGGCGAGRRRPSVDYGRRRPTPARPASRRRPSPALSPPGACAVTGCGTRSTRQVGAGSRRVRARAVGPERCSAAGPARLRVDVDVESSSSSSPPRPRICSKLRRSRRETCIWEIADALGDLALAELLVEAQADDLLLALGQRGSAGPRRASTSDDVAEALVLGADLAGAVAVGADRRVEAGRRVRRAGGDALDDLVGRRSRGARRAAGTVGERPSCCVSSSVARRSRRWVSLAERGTRTVHVWSRKWRLISPSIVRPANVEKATLRSGSKRSTALTRARKATWRRSSSLGPRRPKRRATWAARPMCRSTSSLRRRRLRVRAELAEQRILVEPLVGAGRSTSPAAGSAVGHAATTPCVSENDEPSSSWWSATASRIRRGQLVDLDRRRRRRRRSCPRTVIARPAAVELEVDAVARRRRLDEQRDQLVDAEPEVVEVVDAEPALGPERGGDDAGRGEEPRRGRQLRRTGWLATRSRTAGLVDDGPVRRP